MRMNVVDTFYRFCFVSDDAVDVVSGVSRTTLDILHLAKSR